MLFFRFSSGFLLFVLVAFRLCGRLQLLFDVEAGRGRYLFWCVFDVLGCCMQRLESKREGSVFVKKETGPRYGSGRGNQYSVISKSVVRVGQGCGVHLLLAFPAGLK